MEKYLMVGLITNTTLLFMLIMLTLFVSSGFFYTTLVATGYYILIYLIKGIPVLQSYLKVKQNELSELSKNIPSPISK